METTRKIVLFPTDRFFAIVGNLWLPQNPYLLSLPDIFNEKSCATHRARDHVHRPGRIFLSELELYSLQNPRRRICREMEQGHIGVGDIAAVVDFHPEKYRGNAEKRKEYRERKVQTEVLRFSLHQQVFSGAADSLEVYRRSEEFLGVSQLRLSPPDDPTVLPAGDFLESIQCSQPQFMAVNLGQVFHS